MLAIVRSGMLLKPSYAKAARTLRQQATSPSVSTVDRIYRRFNAIVSQLKMHYFSEGAFESLIASQLLKKEKYI